MTGMISTAGYSSSKSMSNTSNTNYGTTENDFMDWLGYGSARRDREYQTYMSNTAYQRAVEDLKAAGLNPALIYGGAEPASTPSGGSAKAGQGAGVIASVGSILLGGAQMMAAAKSASLDGMIAKKTLSLAAGEAAAKSFKKEIPGFGR